MIVNQNRAIAFCLLSLFFLFHGQNGGHLFAQQHFKPLKQGEYEIVEEDSRFNPGAKISGSYEIFGSSRKDGLLTGGSLGGKFFQDISLGFQSKINTNVSLNVKIGNRDTTVSEQDRAYETQNSADETQNQGGTGFELLFDEAYLEYNHNPNAQLRIGRQYINIADRKGLVFEGEANAISQGCRIGTWCYSIGGARLGDDGGSGLFWVQLDYPVYESGVLIADPWGIKPTRQEKSFSVEIFRVVYGGKDVPLAEYGGWTGEFSTAHDTSDGTTAGDPVYFDTEGAEYFGLNLIWNYYKMDLYFTWSNLNGSRSYFSKNSTTDQETVLSSRDVSGNAYLLDVGYRLAEEWKTTLRVFTAGGDSRSSDSESIWEKNSQSYFEVQKGSFGDALIYFNGKNGLGDGHSVSNLSFFALKIGYRDKEDFLTADIGLYKFDRTHAVYTNQTGSTAEKGSNIGVEIDYKMEWRLEDTLYFQLFAAYFEPGNAYSENDSIRLASDPSTFSLLGFGGRYTF